MQACLHPVLPIATVASPRCRSHPHRRLRRPRPGIAPPGPSPTVDSPHPGSLADPRKATAPAPSCRLPSSSAGRASTTDPPTRSNPWPQPPAGPSAPAQRAAAGAPAGCRHRVLVRTTRAPPRWRAHRRSRHPPRASQSIPAYPLRRHRAGFWAPTIVRSLGLAHSRSQVGGCCSTLLGFCLVSSPKPYPGVRALASPASVELRIEKGLFRTLGERAG